MMKTLKDFRLSAILEKVSQVESFEESQLSSFKKVFFRGE